MERPRASLTLVPTPIGNLEDITMRAINTLKSVDTILAEDTRTTGILLRHLGINKPLQSFHIFNEHKALPGFIDRLRKGEIMALVSDAGTPGIADPGFLLVRECLNAKIAVECLPGPTAFVPALVKSGFPIDRFIFEGFIPHKKGRQTWFKEVAEQERTVVCYESPHRLNKTLEQLVEFCGPERLVSVSRELTKLYEETQSGTTLQVQQYFASKEVKGEIVVVIHGRQ
jgi:16S rRNA (cytidine1402-2'-O)-methyltransferase